MLDPDRLGHLFEGIDDGCGMQAEGVCANEKGTLGRLVQVDEQVNRISQISFCQRRQPEDIEEEEFLREAEVFQQQPVTGKRLPRVGKQHLIYAKADRTYAIGTKSYDGRRECCANRRALDMANVVEQQFVQLEDVLALAVQEKPQMIARETREGGAVVQLEPDGNRLLSVFHQPFRLAECRAQHLYRPKRHRVGGGELAGHAPDGLGEESRVSPDEITCFGNVL